MDKRIIFALIGLGVSLVAYFIISMFVNPNYSAGIAVILGFVVSYLIKQYVKF